MLIEKEVLHTMQSLQNTIITDGGTAFIALLPQQRETVGVHTQENERMVSIHRMERQSCPITIRAVKTSSIYVLDSKRLVLCGHVLCVRTTTITGDQRGTGIPATAASRKGTGPRDTGPRGKDLRVPKVIVNYLKMQVVN